MLVDKNGNRLTAKKPITREIAVASIYDKYSTYPSDGLTPRRLARIFKEADVGDVYRQMELFEEMEGKDLHLFSQLQTRKNAVSGIDFDILPFSEEEKDKEICEFVTREIKKLESIIDIFTDLLDAIGKGFSTSEIIWGIEEQQVVIKDIKYRHQKKFFWDEDDVFKVKTDDEPMGIPIPANKFIIHRYKARSGHPSKAGILRVAAWMYLFKNYDVKDWVAFAEVFGMPLRLGKYSSGTSKEDKEALMQALIQIGTDAAGIISEDTEIEFKESAKSSTINVYESLANFCNKEMSKAILGQTLTTDIGQSGSFAASKTHDNVRHDLVEADCKALAQTLRRDLFRPLVYYNFGESQRIPFMKFHSEPPEDQEKNANTYSTLINDIGLPIAEDHIYEKFSIPKPEQGQKILTPGKSLAFKNLSGLIANKSTLNSDKTAIELQRDIDRLADQATKQSLEHFEKSYQPLKKLLDEADSLEEIQAVLSDPDKVKEIFGQMESEELTELLHRAMFAADVLGRLREDVEHRDT